MNDYITLNGKRYATVFGKFQPVYEKPNRVKYTLGGTLDVTYGPASPVEWVGDVRVPVQPDGDSDVWGDIVDFRVIVGLTQSMAYVDHYGDSYTVHVLGPFPELPKVPVIDSAQNNFYIPVRIIKAA